MILNHQAPGVEECKWSALVVFHTRLRKSREFESRGIGYVGYENERIFIDLFLGLLHDVQTDSNIDSPRRSQPQPCRKSYNDEKGVSMPASL